MNKYPLVILLTLSVSFFSCDSSREGRPIGEQNTVTSSNSSEEKTTIAPVVSAVAKDEPKDSQVTQLKTDSTDTLQSSSDTTSVEQAKESTPPPTPAKIEKPKQERQVVIKRDIVELFVDRVFNESTPYYIFYSVISCLLGVVISCLICFRRRVKRSGSKKGKPNKPFDERVEVIIAKYLKEQSYVTSNKFDAYVNSEKVNHSTQSNQPQYAPPVASAANPVTVGNPEEEVLYAQDTNSDIFDRVQPVYKKGFSIFKIVVNLREGRGAFTVCEEPEVVRRVIAERTGLLQSACELSVNSVPPVRVTTIRNGRVELNSGVWKIVEPAKVELS